MPALCEHREQGPLMWNNQFCIKSFRGRRSCCCTSFQYESPRDFSYNLQLFKRLYLYFFFFRREEVRKEAMEDKHKGVKKGKKNIFKVARCISSVSAPQYISASAVHRHETLLLHDCGRGCKAHVSLCAHHQAVLHGRLIARHTGRMTV